MSHEQYQPSYADVVDFDNASRGFIAKLEPCVIKASTGRVVWNNDEYQFINEPCPPTADPKLWRQGQLLAKQGLFEIAQGIYQIRGFDIANITFVEGENGVLVIDPLISVECAEAAYEFYCKHRGQRRVTGLIYSHSHVDHFGGAAGVLKYADKGTPIIAPEGFMEEVLSENVYAGPTMRRRAAYMYGNKLSKGPREQIGVGLGMCTSTGTNSLVPPNTIITSTGETLTVDGIKVTFQLVPETEAPAEMNFYFPDRRALYIAECCTHGMHNIITLRGAAVRDAKAWSRYLDETLVLFGDESDVLFAGHDWPTWGKQEIATLIEEQRDLYAYMHDQTVRLMNQGMNGTEIAEVIQLPKAIQQAWHARGYYGSLSHNVKGIYQKYMTWFDGNPVNLWKYPPKEEGERYIKCMGGIDEVVKKALEFERDNDLRFACTLLGHAVAAEPNHPGARAALGNVFEKLGFGAENATWRNFYLTGALDMRTERKPDKQPPISDTLLAGLSPQLLFGAISVRIDGDAASEANFVIDLHFTDLKERWTLIMSNGALTYRLQNEKRRVGRPAELSLEMTKPDFGKVLQGDLSAVEQCATGDLSLLVRLLMLAAGDRLPGVQSRL